MKLAQDRVQWWPLILAVCYHSLSFNETNDFAFLLPKVLNISRPDSYSQNYICSVNLKA
jgi:hypothetical protein